MLQDKLSERDAELRELLDKKKGKECAAQTEDDVLIEETTRLRCLLGQMHHQVEAAQSESHQVRALLDRYSVDIERLVEEKR